MIRFLPPALLLAYVGRLVITGSGVGDAISVIALCGLFGLSLFLEHQKEPIANKELKERLLSLEQTIATTKDTVNSLKLGINLKQR